MSSGNYQASPRLARLAIRERLDREMFQKLNALGLRIPIVTAVPVEDLRGVVPSLTERRYVPFNDD